MCAAWISWNEVDPPRGVMESRIIRATDERVEASSPTLVSAPPSLGGNDPPSPSGDSL